jgi:prepilin-type N-terminal cleavage/methylation domain-containing protein
MLVYPPISIRRRSKQQGFTLIELLVVISIIMVLAGITFGISRGVQNAQARARAKADLAVLAQALEQFKSDYGDYPWAMNGGSNEGNGKRLLFALAGGLAWYPDGGVPTDMKSRVDFTPAKALGKSYIDLTQFSLSDSDFDTAYGSAEVIYAMDPWGNPYVYNYLTAATKSDWDKFGYVLYSMGPDGTHVAVTNEGEQDQTASANVDNIYAGQ